MDILDKQNLFSHRGEYLMNQSNIIIIVKNNICNKFNSFLFMLEVQYLIILNLIGIVVKTVFN